MLTGKMETQKKKKYGFVILDGLFKTKLRKYKGIGIQVLKNAVK